MDGGTPFVAVHREPRERPDPGTSLFVTALRSYLVVPSSNHGAAGYVLKALTPAIADQWGSALILEVWSSDRPERETGGPSQIRVHANSDSADLAQRFSAVLDGVRILPPDEAPRGGTRAVVEVCMEESPATEERLRSTASEVRSKGVRWLGVSVPASLYRSGTGELFPHRLTLLRRALASGLERALGAWAAENTTLSVIHPYALGRRSLGRTARAIDARLSTVADSFDLVLGASPVNAAEMWSRFQAAGYERAPRFQYRPLPFDPEGLKRTLFHVPVERIEDPLVGQLIREKQQELDLRISMLRNRGTPEFLLGSIGLFGAPDEALVQTARHLLEILPTESDGDDEESQSGELPVETAGMVRLATAELARYAEAHRDFPQAVQVRDDIAAGMLVSRGTVCISNTIRVSPRRVRALIEHEIGTHVLTYFNGTRQPLKLLASGLAKYGALQEGLAVLSEYLVAGLTQSRARTVAARVMAVNDRVDGADFVETFRALRTFDLGPRNAFSITLRVHRGGGLTKDYHYMGGLAELLLYLRDGGRVETLFLGKMGLSHIHVVRELALRGVLRPAVAKPAYADGPDARRRLLDCRHKTVVDVLTEARP
jgi:uncharacterized protein (TIGR02421 family)